MWKVPKKIHKIKRTMKKVPSIPKIESWWNLSFKVLKRHQGLKLITKQVASDETLHWTEWQQLKCKFKNKKMTKSSHKRYAEDKCLKLTDSTSMKKIVTRWQKINPVLITCRHNLHEVWINLGVTKDSRIIQNAIHSKLPDANLQTLWTLKRILIWIS